MSDPHLAAVEQEVEFAVKELARLTIELARTKNLVVDLAAENLRLQNSLYLATAQLDIAREG